jgi:hypothetical protein
MHQATVTKSATAANAEIFAPDEVQPTSSEESAMSVFYCQSSF